MKVTKSVFEVTNFRTMERLDVVKDGAGQKTVNELRKEYPRSKGFYKIVLTGHEIDGDFFPLDI